MDFQLNAIYNVVEKSESLNADFMLITTWTDQRLANPSSPEMTLYATTVLDNGLIWGPKLTFQNRRDLTNPIDGVVRAYNTGQVQVVQRYLATYAMNFNMRDFPFDTQNLTFNLRSTTYDKSIVEFVPVTDPASKQNSTLILQMLVDPTFTYDSYDQWTYTIPDGIFTNYHLLSISINARRMATMSSLFLIFPICILCTALCLVYSVEPGSNARLSVPLGCITSTLAFSFVVSNQCPPVSYITRLHLMIFLTYFVSIIALFLNYYLWGIEFAKKELGRLNGDKKNLLMDAHWMPRKIGNNPTKVVVLPGGINKPAEPSKEPSEELPNKSKNERIKNDYVSVDKVRNRYNSGKTDDGPSRSQTPRRSAWAADSKPSVEGLHLPGSMTDTNSSDSNNMIKSTAAFLPHISPRSRSFPRAPSDESALVDVKVQNDTSNTLHSEVTEFSLCSTAYKHVSII